VVWPSKAVNKKEVARSCDDVVLLCGVECMKMMFRGREDYVTSRVPETSKEGFDERHFGGRDTSTREKIQKAHHGTAT
jgi:hypothetical protein